MTAPSSQYLGGLYGIDENFLVGGPQNFDAVSKLSKMTFDNFWFWKCRYRTDRHQPGHRYSVHPRTSKQDCKYMQRRGDSVQQSMPIRKRHINLIRQNLIQPLKQQIQESNLDSDSMNEVNEKVLYYTRLIRKLNFEKETL